MCIKVDRKSQKLSPLYHPCKNGGITSMCTSVQVFALNHVKICKHPSSRKAQYKKKKKKKKKNNNNNNKLLSERCQKHFRSI